MKKLLLNTAALLAFSALVVTAAPRPSSLAQAGATTSTVSGQLTTNGGKFFVTDAATKNTFEVRGEGLERWAGQKVRVSGQVSEAAAGQPNVLVVSQIDRIGVAAGAGGSKAAAAGLKAGLSKAAIVGIAGGAAGATVGTLYAADVIGDEESVSRR